MKLCIPLTKNYQATGTKKERHSWLEPNNLKKGNKTQAAATDAILLGNFVIPRINLGVRVEVD